MKINCQLKIKQESEKQTKVKPLCPHPSLLLRIKFTRGAVTSSPTKHQCGYLPFVPVHGLQLDKHLHTVYMGCSLISVLVAGEPPPTPTLTLVSAGLFCSPFLHSPSHNWHAPLSALLNTLSQGTNVVDRLSFEQQWSWLSLWGWLLLSCHTRHPTPQSWTCHLNNFYWVL